MKLKLTLPLLLILFVFTAASADLEDTDGDGLANFEEAEIGTDPADIDTDDDGFTDRSEVEVGTDPLDDDSHLDKLIVSGFASGDFPIKSFLIAIVLATILAESVLLFHFRGRKSKEFNQF